MKILIAEDDPISRRFLEKVLEKLGHNVTSCKDGEEAWANYQHSLYRVVISDWMMPGTDGLELCKRIRAHAKSEYSYFMMLTAKSNKSDFLEAMDAGADDYLTKPLDPEEVELRLRLAERWIMIQKPRDDAPRIYPVVKPGGSFR